MPCPRGSRGGLRVLAHPRCARDRDRDARVVDVSVAQDRRVRRAANVRGVRRRRTGCRCRLARSTSISTTSTGCRPRAICEACFARAPRRPEHGPLRTECRRRGRRRHHRRRRRAAAAEITVARGRRTVVALTAAPPPPPSPAATEELHVGGDDLGDVLLVAFLVVVRAGLDAALDEDLAALGEVLRADLGALAPHHDAVPLGALLALTVLVVPALAGRDAQLADALPARRVPHVGIGAEVSDEDDFVDSTGHDVFFVFRDTRPVDSVRGHTALVDGPGVPRGG